MISDITIAIKTVERPECLNRLIESIFLFYPKIKIIVGDDSKNPIIRDDVYKYITFPFDIGASKGRNEILKEVDTKYVLFVDDDFVFTKNTNLNAVKYILENNYIDILGLSIEDKNGIEQYSTGLFRRKDNHLFCFRDKFNNSFTNFVGCDFITQCFMAETETIKKFSWPENIKTEEHYFYFYNLMHNLDIGSTSEAKIIHDSSLETYEYAQLRDQKRVAAEVGKMWRKEGIKYITIFDKNLYPVVLEDWSDLTIKMYEAYQNRKSPE